jgi:hypothetical protein
MKRIAISLIAVSMSLSIIGNASNGSSKTKTEIATHQGNHRHQSTETINLNNGKKWKVDENMMVHIRNMEKDVAGFRKSKPSDYASLAEKLKQNIGLLTSNCTMKGKAHDELHKWLLPYIDLVNKLAKSNNETEGEALFQTLQHSFKTFNQYFQ